MKVAVIGAGIYGCAIAGRLAKRHKVTLFEAGGSIMEAASRCNQARLHLGYHYPRSPETIEECKASAQAFTKAYGPVVRDGFTHYAVMKDSRTSADEYLDVLRRHDLPCQVLDEGMLRHRHYRKQWNADRLDMVFRAREAHIDLGALRVMLEHRLRIGGLDVRFGTKPGRAILRGFDKVIIATYAGINDVLDELGLDVKPRQYEMVEKPVISAPPALNEFDDTHNFGLVVMDGEDGCSIDTYHAMENPCTVGHVTEAIHSRNTGLEAEIPRRLRSLIDGPVVDDPEHSRWTAIEAAVSRYVPMIDGAKYMGSMFTVRVVLPNVDNTDERPTLVTWHNERVASVFSGKIAGCVRAAEEISRRIDADGRNLPMERSASEEKLQVHTGARQNTEADGRAPSVLAA